MYENLLKEVIKHRETLLKDINASDRLIANSAYMRGVCQTVALATNTPLSEVYEQYRNLSNQRPASRA